MTDFKVTGSVAFGRASCDKPHPFSVNPGISLEDGLSQLSHLLACAQASAVELSDTTTPNRGLVGAVVHSVESAKALADALLERA
jgi:hypothetical protein